MPPSHRGAPAPLRLAVAFPTVALAIWSSGHITDLLALYVVWLAAVAVWVWALIGVAE